MVKPVQTITAFIIGPPGEGKSCFLQSCPDAYIFNLDKTSTTTPTVNATLWPGISESGQPIGDNGTPLILKWEAIEEKIAILKRLATENKPRPSLIVFDSLSEWIRLLRDWIPHHAAELSIGANTDLWNNLHGPAAYDCLYNYIIGTISSLSNHGYGVYVVGHVVNETIPIGDNRFVFRPQLTITPNFWKRLYDLFELVAAIVSATFEEQYEQEVTSLVRGQTKIEKRIRTREVRKYFLSVEKTDLEGVVKSRVRIPGKIELPHEGGWAAFERVYNDCM